MRYTINSLGLSESDVELIDLAFKDLGYERLGYVEKERLINRVIDVIPPSERFSKLNAGALILKYIPMTFSTQGSSGNIFDKFDNMGKEPTIKAKIAEHLRDIATMSQDPKTSAVQAQLAQAKSTALLAEAVLDLDK